MFIDQYDNDQMTVLTLSPNELREAILAWTGQTSPEDKTLSEVVYVFTYAPGEAPQVSARVSFLTENSVW